MNTERKPPSRGKLDRPTASTAEPQVSLATLTTFPRALIVKEVAGLLKCSERHVYTLNARGTLPNIRGMGAALRFAPSTVLTLINGTPAETVTAHPLIGAEALVNG